LVTKIDAIGDIIFDEDRHHELGKISLALSNGIAVTTAEIKRLETAVSDLIAGGICKSCNRKLDNVDNSEHIAKHNLDIQNLFKKLDIDTKKLTKIEEEIKSLSDTKSLVDKKNKLELSKDKLEVEIGSLRNTLKTKQDDLKKYNDNIASIKKNEDIDIQITKIGTKIAVCEHQKEDLSKKIQKTISEMEANTINIENKERLIQIITKESEIEKVFKIYIDMVGKKGISKLVLRSVLPIINSELERLLDEVTDFKVEIFIDDKNEVKFSIVKDDIEKSLKSGSGFELTTSSIALRCVLGKMSTLPMPNFIAFDEVLGRVANDNIERMKPLFDKIKDMFDIVFFISHNDLVKDWADNIVTISKENNISKILIK
jgi:DNA repair exonuclease SbcCD ATPase subunit